MVSIRFPEILGNGKDLSQVLFSDRGVPGGLFTPSLTFGALLGAVLGNAWSMLWPGVSSGLFALLGAGAVVSATTQGLRKTDL